MKTRISTAPTISRKHKLLAFSFYELILIISLVTTISAISAPSFISLINKTRIIHSSNDLITSLNLARSYAVTRQTPVHLCKLINHETTLICQPSETFNSNWSNGWLVFADLNSNNEFDEKEDTLLHHHKITSPVSIIFNQRGRLRFFSDGSSRSAGFYLCDYHQQHYRHIYLLHSGRARVNSNLSKKQRKVCDDAKPQS